MKSREKLVNQKKTKTLDLIPEIFQKELDADIPLAEAFSKFSPYKQKEFLEYIETAKREETTLSRIEKLKPMILENIGLNNKYR
jgi:uncharacterized protein YdeI (YjbR/CyaY-like superfamily)